MKNKKQAFITFRCSDEIKELLEEISIEKEWSLSHTVEKIIRDYCRKEELRRSTDLTKYDFLSCDARNYKFVLASLF